MTACELLAVKDVGKRGVLEISRVLALDGLALKEPLPLPLARLKRITELESQVELLKTKLRDAGVE